jgi:glucose-6-phosphate 1-dehydrogenase
MNLMDDSHSDALVFFGATGDLAFKQIFPALQALVKRHNLDIPIVGVAKAGWNLDQLKARARDSVTQHGGLDQAAFAKLSGLLQYVDSDYRDPETYVLLRQVLGQACRPLHYFAIPPSMFAAVAEGLAQSGCAMDARVVVEKPFGRDLASARELHRILHQFFPEPAIVRIDHFLGKEPVQTVLSSIGLPGTSPAPRFSCAGFAVPAWDEPGRACGRGSRASGPRRWLGSGGRYL